MNTNKRRITNRILLNHGKVKKYWNDIDPDLLAPILQEMDSKENWVVNNDAGVMFTITDFAKTLSLNEMDDKKFYENLDQFILFLAYINSSWSFRILKWLEENRNPILMKITIDCSTNISRMMYDDDEEDIFLTPSQLFVDRMNAVKNLGLIAKIFSKQRSSVINILLSEMEEKEFEES